MVSNFPDDSSIGKDGEYQLDKVIGYGTLSTVRLGRHRLTNSPVAIKIIKLKQRMLDEGSNRKGGDSLIFNNRVRVEKEIEYWSRLDHPNVVKLFQVIREERKQERLIYLVMQYGAGGDLLSYLLKRDGNILPIDTTRKYLLQICRAVADCHAQGIIHGDVKLENILLNGGFNDESTCLLGDFGLSRAVGSPEEFMNCGTIEYAPPEFLHEDENENADAEDESNDWCHKNEEIDSCHLCSGASDIWSIGVLFFALLKGRLPFEGPMPRILKHRIIHDDPLADLDETEIATSHYSLLREFLQKDPNKRIDFASIFTHPFFVGSPTNLNVIPVLPTAIDSKIHREILTKLGIKSDVLTTVIESRQIENSLYALFHILKRTDAVVNLEKEKFNVPSEKGKAALRHIF